jgi:hypothetical protein
VNRQVQTPDMPVKSRRIRRSSAAVLLVAMGLGGGIAFAPAASAATASIGGLNFAPATGSDVSPINFTTVTSGAAKGCPTGSTNVRGIVNGPGGWTNIAVLSNTNSGVSTTSDFSEPLADTFSGLAQANGLTVLAGAYNVQIICQNRLGTTQYGTFDGLITFTSPTAFTTTPVATGTATTTALSVSPASPQNSGVPVTLSATVSPAPTDGGSVQFKDGSANVGVAQTVSSSGAVSVTTSTLASGSHSFTAVFTPSSGSASLGSTSPATAYTVNGASTTAGLSAPSSMVQNTPANFNVTLSPSNATGSVTLKEGSAVLGTSPVSAGSATIAVTFATTGSHSVVAYYTPDSGNFAAAQSAPVAVNVTAPVTPSNGETVETTVTGGTLTLSIANISTVVLPTPTLDQSAGLLVTSGVMNPVTVTDTRAGAPGFVVSGQVTDFLSGTNKINGYNLGWAPTVIDKSASMGVTAGPTVQPAPGAQPGTTPLDATQGLKSSRSLATNAPGGLGTTHVGANLSLLAPTNTQVGTYDATLTLTVI